MVGGGEDFQGEGDKNTKRGKEEKVRPRWTLLSFGRFAPPRVSGPLHGRRGGAAYRMPAWAQLLRRLDFTHCPTLASRVPGGGPASWTCLEFYFQAGSDCIRIVDFSQRQLLDHVWRSRLSHIARHPDRASPSDGKRKGINICLYPPHIFLDWNRDKLSLTI